MYLKNSSATTVLDAPISYLTIVIAGTDKVLFERVEVQRHNSCRVSGKSSERISRLYSVVIEPIKYIKGNQKGVISYETTFGKQSF